MDTVRLAGIVDDSMVDGPGVRYAIFFQGCRHNCAGCHNPTTHNYNAGFALAIADILADLGRHKYITGVTLSGGEPLDQPEAAFELVSALKERGYHIIIYTGYTYEAAMLNDLQQKVILLADIVIDGRFDIEKRSLAVPFVGSLNQRAIDIPKTIRSGEITPAEFR